MQGIQLQTFHKEMQVVATDQNYEYRRAKVAARTTYEFTHDT